MKFAFRSASMGNIDITEALRQIRECGYDGVEICLEPAPLRPGTVTPAEAENLRAACDQLHLEIASASFHADATELPRRVEQTFQAVEVAEWLGAEVLIVNAERAAAEPAERERQFADVVERMRRLCDIAAPRGIRLAVEPEPLLVIDTADRMLRLLDAVASPALAVNLDIGHAEVSEGDVPAVIERLGPHIARTHIEDIAGRVHKHLVPGEGDIDFPAVFAAFDRVGYDGIHTIDLFGLGDDAAETARHALEALRHLAGAP